MEGLFLHIQQMLTEYEDKTGYGACLRMTVKKGLEDDVVKLSLILAGPEPEPADFLYRAQQDYKKGGDIELMRKVVAIIRGRQKEVLLLQGKPTRRASND